LDCGGGGWDGGDRCGSGGMIGRSAFGRGWVECGVCPRALLQVIAIDCLARWGPWGAIDFSAIFFRERTNLGSKLRVCSQREILCTKMFSMTEFKILS
jgi:hypothetical protein